MYKGGLKKASASSKRQKVEAGKAAVKPLSKLGNAVEKHNKGDKSYLEKFLGDGDDAKALIQHIKALEQLQNLIGQFALGLRRLEVQEQQEIEEQDLSVELNDYKRRARKVTLRLAMAANRSTWVSCCEVSFRR